MGEIIKFIFLLIVVGVATAQQIEYTQLQLKGSCPKIRFIKNLDAFRVLGWWYIVYSTVDQRECLKNEVQAMYATAYDQKTINVQVCCQISAKQTIEACVGSIANGTATATTNVGEFMFAWNDKIYPKYVLDTDYDNFIVSYGCTPGPRGGSDELLYILSRDVKLNATLDRRSLNKLQENGVDLSIAKRSVWRVPEFASLNPPTNWNDNELICGFRHQATNPGTDCGVCGDPITQSPPRANEMGGQWYRGIITGRYTAGSVIPIDLELTQSHGGFFEFRVCASPQNGGETQNCFNQNLLQRADGGGSRTPADRGTGWYFMQYRLPAGLRCQRCVLQWNYRAGNSWGDCGNGTGAVGCGPQETFRGCSDITIT